MPGDNMRYLCFDTAINGSFTLVLLQQEYPVQQCLFQDTKDAGIWDSAPWLFETGSNVYARINHPMASLHHVLFFDSTENLDALREHLQYFIYKKIEDKEHFFRFWDARVLRKYLDRCSTAEVTNFFGEVVDAIYLEDQESDAFVSLSINKKGKIDKQKIQRADFFPGDTKPLNELKDPFEPIKNSQQKPDEAETKSKRKFFMD